MSDRMVETKIYEQKCVSERAVILPVSFTTDGSGVPTLDIDYHERVTIALSATDKYTITFPEASAFVAVVSPSDSSVAYTVTKDVSASTLVIDFGANFFSKSCDVVLHLADSENNI